MHPSLALLIARFRAAQDRGVAFLVDVLGPALGVRLPPSPQEWVLHCGETGLHNVRQHHGVELYAHGYGIELTFADGSIDFDWGEYGEPDGFDVWRLWNFARNNLGADACPEHNEVRAWVEDAIAAGELVRDRYLYYHPAHRAFDPRAGF